MVYRLSPENVRPPRGGPSGAAALAVVLALALGIWFLAGGDPGSQSGGAGGPVPTRLPTEGAPTSDPVSGLPYVAPADLPPAALDLFVEVTGDAPPAGTAFDDGAGQLPDQQPGYYSAYPVGPGGTGQELVVGRGGEVYWTTDGEASFARVGP